jgi:hypothetical protein
LTSSSFYPPSQTQRRTVQLVPPKDAQLLIATPIAAGRLRAVAQPHGPQVPDTAKAAQLPTTVETTWQLVSPFEAH